jgi:glutamyl/glutaminyl-tRNA synthetase
VNRHYLKAVDPIRLAELTVPFFTQAGVRMAPDGHGIDFLASAMAMASVSVDRLNQIPARLAFLFEFDADRALADASARAELETAGARSVLKSLADELKTSPRLTRESFRELAGRVRAGTGQKGRALFHPIRLALTGRGDGPELDLAVPAIDRGADLPRSAGLPTVVGNRERAAAFAAALGL